MRLRRTLVNGAKLGVLTPANPEIDALSPKVKLLAMDAWKARDRSHRARHTFMAEAYGLALKLRENKAEFVGLMRAEGIKKPDIDLLYYKTVQVFQPEEKRSHPNWKSDASRLARAFIQAETLGYKEKDFVRRIEREEVVNGRRVGKRRRQAYQAG